MSEGTRMLARIALVTFGAAVAGMTAAWLLVWFVALSAGFTPEPGLIAGAMVLVGGLSAFAAGAVLIEHG